MKKPDRVIEITAFSIISCTPGVYVDEVPPTQVHILIETKALQHPLVIRLKSAEVIDEVIAALIKHREDVWGKPTPSQE